MSARVFLALLLAVFCCPALAGEATYGAPLTLEKTTPIASILDDPAAFAGRTVRVEGGVTEVCSHKGCWLRLEAEDGRTLLVKSTGDRVVVPTDSAGRRAVVEGEVVVTHGDKGHEHAGEGHACPDASVRLETRGVALL